MVVHDLSIFSLWAIAAILVLATYTELQSATIPNWITLPAIAFAFCVSFIGVGIPLSGSLLGFLAGFGFLFIFYLFGGMGGGDVKLMGAIGALLGVPAILHVLLYTAIIGGAMAIMALIWHKRLWQGVTGSLALLGQRNAGPSIDDVDCRETGPDATLAQPLTIPYGLAIVFGTLAHIVVQAEGLSL